MSGVTNKQIYRRIVNEGFTKGNLAALDEVVTPDYEEHEQRPPGLPAGLEGFKAWVAGIRSAFPDGQPRIDD